MSIPLDQIDEEHRAEMILDPEGTLDFDIDWAVPLGLRTPPTTLGSVVTTLDGDTQLAGLVILQQALDGSISQTRFHMPGGDHTDPMFAPPTGLWLPYREKAIFANGEEDPRSFAIKVMGR